MSDPDGSVANALLTEVDELVCVTPSDVYLRTAANGIVLGRAIPLPMQAGIDVPAIRTQLLKAYPLIDRWVSKRQSVSTTLEHMLEYTVALIHILFNYRPRFAVLETGAPHHLFSYCLDAALRYLDVPIYYLYGNAFDGRCLVVNGNEKHAFVPVSDYSAQSVVDEYIDQVRRNATYVPADSVKSLTPVLHKWRSYSFFLHLRRHVAGRYGKVARRGGNCTSTSIRLSLPYVGLRDLLGILRAHYQYRKLIAAAGPFNVERIGADDIVYVGHMVPEATSFPESPDYPGEIDVLIDLKNRFPSANVFYREHPAIAIYAEFGHVHFQGLHKCPAFYRQLERLGIEVVPPSIHITKIRERGCLFATKTGRAAVENSVLGIPTLLYGFPFYGRDLPLASSVDRLTPEATVRSIKAQAAAVANPASAVRTHLVATFAGSIENPGIGLVTDASARSLFEASLVRLIRKLENSGRSNPISKQIFPLAEGE